MAREERIGLPAQLASRAGGRALVEDRTGCFDTIPRTHIKLKIGRSCDIADVKGEASQVWRLRWNNKGLTVGSGVGFAERVDVSAAIPGIGGGYYGRRPAR